MHTAAVLHSPVCHAAKRSVPGLPACVLAGYVQGPGWLILFVGHLLVCITNSLVPRLAGHGAGRKVPLAPSVQTMMWAVGLRGAVAYGLAMNLPASGSVTGIGIPAVESATLVVVLATTLVFGGATGGTWTADRAKA